MASCSVGILMYRLAEEGAEVLLVHPGGPFWRRKDLGVWSIPKGEPQPGETAQETARREFAEELGAVPSGPLVPLGRIRQRAGKVVEAFALRGELEAEKARCSSEAELEWPRGSGHIRRFPEIDQAAWFSLPEARLRILAAQGELLERLEKKLADESA
ncbi:NUDIX domain-containing protein [Bosea sp. F3-2]|uniref:NUDIX domain-containing protein n=1 Tax=Bosea sp. F3-2 TaxID=2599640 RepID=UPI0011ED2741|nr:NUDIX domain-containing protein [Bosea sp. F3-2]QEL21971.1 NUDIX domain-containing protein [Bosea sp. F3-2]